MPAELSIDALNVKVQNYFSYYTPKVTTATGGRTVNVSTVLGRYLTVGKMVYVQCFFEVDSITGGTTASCYISLPLPSLAQPLISTGLGSVGRPFPDLLTVSLFLPGTIANPQFTQVGYVPLNRDALTTDTGGFQVSSTCQWVFVTGWYMGQ